MAAEAREQAVAAYTADKLGLARPSGCDGTRAEPAAAAVDVAASRRAEDRQKMLVVMVVVVLEVLRDSQEAGDS